MSKHTPGPWFVASLNDALFVVDRMPPHYDTGGTEVICGRFDPGPEGEANADLVSAAPDLLSALQGVLRVADRKTDEFDAARAAIAKATRRPSDA